MRMELLLTTQSLAIQRDPQRVGGAGRTRMDLLLQDGAHGGDVEAGEEPVQGGLAGGLSGEESQAGEDGGGLQGDPFGDSENGVLPGEAGGDGQRQERRQRVADTGGASGIRDGAEGSGEAVGIDLRHTGHGRAPW